MPKENETSKMKITNGDDHCFLEFLKINFTPVNYTGFTKKYYQASLNNCKYSKNPRKNPIVSTTVKVKKNSSVSNRLLLPNPLKRYDNSISNTTRSNRCFLLMVG
jgi:hypothetical protein